MNGLDALRDKIADQGRGFGPRVEVVVDRVDREGRSWARGLVRDNGPGLEQSQQERIFDLFYTSKEAGKGTGMGLAICFAILRNHGGSITVQSTPGEGLAAEVLLPPAGEGAPV
jgi:signal transduction histidine kinase